MRSFLQNDRLHKIIYTLEDSQEESTAIVEEFYPEATAENDPPTPITPLPAPLTNKLATKAAKVA